MNTTEILLKNVQAKAMNISMFFMNQIVDDKTYLDPRRGVRFL